MANQQQCPTPGPLAETEPTSGKRPYTTPALRTYGTVEALTRGAAGSKAADGGGTLSGP